MRCGGCDQPKVNVGGKDANYLCMNNRCVKYAGYAKVRCPECKCAPADVESVNKTSAKFRCPNDHLFNSEASSWISVAANRPAEAAPAAVKETKAEKSPSKSQSGAASSTELRDAIERIEESLASRKRSTGRPPQDVVMAYRDGLKTRRLQLLKELESVALELAALEDDLSAGQRPQRD
jgi:hypothetical protein